MIILPTLQRRIRSAFSRLVLLFGLLGLLLVAGIFFAGQMPTSLVRMNYDSIVYARHMEEALHQMRLAGIAGVQRPQDWQQHFQDALDKAKGNVTEQDEQETVRAIERHWQEYRNAPGESRAAALDQSLAGLVKVNEQGIFRRLDENALLRNLLILGAGAIFALGILWAFLLADSVATRLSHPLRRACELFQDKPSLRVRLPLPAPQTLEVRLLFDELARLWARLGELDALNVDHLLAEKRKLEVILESAEDAVLVLEQSGVVAHASDRMLRLLGLPADAVVGKPWDDLSTLSANYLSLRTALSRDGRDAGDITLRTGEEEQLYKARRRHLLDAAGAVVGQVFLLSDVTEKRRREALRAEMMDWISHELKTPMQSLGLAVDLLARRTDLDEDTHMLVDTLQQDVARLRIVAKEFMDMAGMNPLYLQLRLERVDLGRRLGEWLRPFALTAREGNQRLTLEAADTPLNVVLDTERFDWVLSNLVGNALRICPAGAAITVGARVENDSAVLWVEDNGPGIPPELEARLFLPFSHGREAGRRESLAGLGLAIAHTIVEAHGGTLRYAPRSGGGSVFTVTLPLEGSEHADV